MLEIGATFVVLEIGGFEPELVTSLRLLNCLPHPEALTPARVASLTSQSPALPLSHWLVTLLPDVLIGRLLSRDISEGSDWRRGFVSAHRCSCILGACSHGYEL